MSKDKNKNMNREIFTDKLLALKYMIDHNVYGNEWQGAGMYEAIVKIIRYKGKSITTEYLRRLLKEAENR
jgi:hypothetical protein